MNPSTVALILGSVEPSAAVQQDRPRTAPVSIATPDRWSKWAGTLVQGYLTAGRTFAYLGLPPLYPAEVFLVAAAFFQPREWSARGLRELARGYPVVVFLVAFLLWGMVECARGLLLGRPVVEVSKGFAAHYYPIFFVIGWTLASRFPAAAFVGLIQRSALTVSIYGCLYAAVFSKLFITFPWASGVPIFSSPAMPSFTIVGLLAFEPLIGFALTPLLILNTAALLLNAGRALWLSLGVGAAIVIAMGSGRRLARRLLPGLVILVLLICIVGPILPAAEGRLGSLSPRWIAARLLTMVSPSAAEELLADSGQASDLQALRSISGTIDWRKHFWQTTVDSLTENDLWLVGHGYGMALGSLAGYGSDVRTPHNYGIYLIGYSGLIGLAIFVMFIVALALSILHLPPSLFRTFLLAEVGTVITIALFGNGLETPFIAVPFYLTTGLAFGVAKSR
jgi:hypothetical protein